MISDWQNIVSVTLIAFSFFAIGVTATRLSYAPPSFIIDKKDTENKTTDDETSNKNCSVFLLSVCDFSANKHRNQRRKNLNQTPYINHPLSVASRLGKAGITDLNILSAAILHDTVEDTETTIEEIETYFGHDIASIVAQVTDDKTLPKQQRKQLQIEHAPHCSYAAKLVKLADKLDNLTDLLHITPIGWSSQRVSQYFEWSQKVVAGLRGTNSVLEEQLDQVFAKRQVAMDVADATLASTTTTAATDAVNHG